MPATKNTVKFQRKVKSRLPTRKYPQKSSWRRFPNRSVNQMKHSTQLPTQIISAGSHSKIETRPPSSSSGAARESSTSPQFPKAESTPDSTRVGNLPSKNSRKKGELPTDGESGTLKLVAVSTLNWVLVRLQYLELVTIGKVENSAYYEIRLPTRLWKHEGGLFSLVGNVGNSEK